MCIFFRASVGACASAITEIYPVGSTEHTLTDTALEDPTIEEKLGQVYCERILECQGTFVRNGEIICHALDPEAFQPELRKLYSQE